jgi:hypothetical protein
VYICWCTAKNSRHPSKYRGKLSPAFGNTGVISLRYQLPLCVRFNRWGVPGDMTNYFTSFSVEEGLGSLLWTLGWYPIRIAPSNQINCVRIVVGLQRLLRECHLETKHCRLSIHLYQSAIHDDLSIHFDILCSLYFAVDIKSLTQISVTV